jgi:hypothetical protein
LRAAHCRDREFEQIETNLAQALDLARVCHAAYLSAASHLRRLFNRRYSSTSTSMKVLDAAGRQDESEPDVKCTSLSEVLGRSNEPDDDQTPGAERRWVVLSAVTPYGMSQVWNECCGAPGRRQLCTR